MGSTVFFLGLLENKHVGECLQSNSIQGYNVERGAVEPIKGELSEGVGGTLGAGVLERGWLMAGIGGYKSEDREDDTAGRRARRVCGYSMNYGKAADEVLAEGADGADVDVCGHWQKTLKQRGCKGFLARAATLPSKWTGGGFKTATSTQTSESQVANASSALWYVQCIRTLRSLPSPRLKQKRSYFADGLRVPFNAFALSCDLNGNPRRIRYVLSSLGPQEHIGV